MRRFLVVFGGARLSRKGERLCVENGNTSTSLPVRYIESVVLVGSVSMSHGAIGLLLSTGIPAFFITAYGSFRGVLSTQVLGSKERQRLLQYKALGTKRLNVARSIVASKLSAIEKLFSLDLSHLRTALKETDSLESVMGVEGSASREMFRAFARNIDSSGLSFRGRSYRPPMDPVNALLSLSYTFSHALAFALSLQRGYDPYLSFLHSKRGTHPSFCSDVIEPVRPTITKLLEKPLKEHRFTEQDFRREGRGVYLKKESFPKFLRWLESVKGELVRSLQSALSTIEEELR